MILKHNEWTRGTKGSDTTEKGQYFWPHHNAIFSHIVILISLDLNQRAISYITGTRCKLGILRSLLWRMYFNSVCISDIYI